jgi:hypothetical protein
MSTIINAYTVNAQNSQVDAVLAIYQDRMYSIDECFTSQIGQEHLTAISQPKFFLCKEDRWHG